MRVILASDKEGFNLKETIKKYLLEKEIELIDCSLNPEEDFVDSSLKVAKELKKDNASLGIVFDGYGVGSFITLTKVKGIIAANISDERSAFMTRNHNNTTVISIGAKLVTNDLAKSIVDNFLTAQYDAGRHQIRVDMLNKMC